MVLVKMPAGFKVKPTVKYRRGHGDWHTRTPVRRPIAHIEHKRGNHYRDPDYRLTAAGDVEFCQKGKWVPLCKAWKKTRDFVADIMACEPVVVTRSKIGKDNKTWVHDSYVSVHEISNPRIDDHGLHFELGELIEWCAA